MEIEATTPAAHWRAHGEPDPHGDHYNGERAKLTLGMMTDDALANAAFMYYDVRPPVQSLLDGTAYLPIVYMTAVKDRIRWLSRRLHDTLLDAGAKQAEIDRLMLEHCPDEMTKNQRDEWARCQKLASDEGTRAIEALLMPGAASGTTAITSGVAQKPLTVADIERAVDLVRALPPEPIGEWMRKQGHPPEHWRLILPKSMVNIEMAAHPLPDYVALSNVLTGAIFMRREARHGD